MLDGCAEEAERLAVLVDCDLLDTPREPLFDQLAALAAETLNAPVALLSLIDRDRQWIKAAHGVEPREMPRNLSFCASAVATADLVVVADASADPRFCDNPLVTGEPHIRFYAGAPLVVHGQAIGALCVVDYVPRVLDAAGRDRLRSLARMLAGIVELRQECQEHRLDSALLADGPVMTLTWTARPGWPVADASPNLLRFLGLAPETAEGQGYWFEKHVHPKDKRTLRHVLLSHDQPETGRAELDYRIVDREGRDRWVKQFTRAERDSRGRLLRIRAYLIEQTEQKQLELQIKSDKERFSLTLDAASLGTWELHVPTGHMVTGSRWRDILDLQPEDAIENVVGWKERIHPLDRARVETALQRHLRGETEVFETEHRLRCRNGAFRWAHVFGRTVDRSAGGAAVRILGTITDVTARKNEQYLVEKQKTLLALLNRAQEIFVLQKDMRAACELLLEPIIKLSESQFGFIGEVGGDVGGDGPDQPSMTVRAISDMSWSRPGGALPDAVGDAGIEALDLAELGTLFGAVIESGQPVVDNDVAHTPSEAADRPDIDSLLGLPIQFSGKTLGMIGLANRPDGYDESVVELLAPLAATLGLLMHARHLEQARVAAEEELARLASLDELTSIPNRRAFTAQANRIRSETRPMQRGALLCLMDIDHFKRVNDTHGHAAGDGVLQQFAEHVSGVLRASDLFGRIGGEEFACVLRDVAEADAFAAIDKVRRTVEASPAVLGDLVVPHTVSIGAVWLDAWPGSVEQVMARADEALYEAKATGRNRVCIVGRTSEADAMGEAA